MIDPVSHAHFQLFALDSRALVRWRLLSGNNRELGRSVASYPDAESGLIAVKVFVETLDELTSQVRRRDAEGWAWLLLADGEPVATCGRPYDRQVRCEQALANFRMLAAAASSKNDVVVTAARRWVHLAHGRQPMELNSGLSRARRTSQPRVDSGAQ
jgi:hypothetical protein